jgi:hypothetical protein
MSNLCMSGHTCDVNTCYLFNTCSTSNTCHISNECASEYADTLPLTANTNPKDRLSLIKIDIF